MQTGDRIPLVYVAGPYSAPTFEERAANIQRAAAVGRLVVEAGAYARVPHLLGGQCDELHTWEWWMAATSADLAQCDAAVFVPGWERSRGSRLEHDQSEREGRPIFELPSLTVNLRDVDGYALLEGRVVRFPFWRWAESVANGGAS